MNGLIISWSLVFLVTVWVFFDRIWDTMMKLPQGTRDVLNELGGMTERFFYWFTSDIPNYIRGYFHTGRHRRDNPPSDSEVDLWPGADESFVDTLRGMNAVR
jgi:hypothetical protein